MIGTILFVTFLVLLVIGAPIALCLGAAALLVVFTTGDVSPIVLGQRMFGSLDSFTIMAIPLFMLAGNLMSSGGISKRLTDFCDAILGWMPGGLGVVSILSCMIFGALSGSPTATCAAIGSIMVPAMIEAGYDKRFALASVAVPGVLGCIIPPSTVMISYSSVTDASVGSMFMGGIVPGILMGVAMMIVAVKYGISHKDVKRTPFSLKNLLQKFVKAIGALLVPVIALCICGLFFYMNRNSDDIDVAFTVKNETKEKIDTVGIAMGKKCILNRTNGEKFYFPKDLVKEKQDKAIVFVVSKDGIIAKSGEIDLKENKEVSIREIKEGEISLDIAAQKTDIKISIPRLDAWKVSTDEKFIKGSYEANTDSQYTLYLLGKGGKLGISSTEMKGIRVTASWEKPKDKIDSWLIFND